MISFKDQKETKQIQYITSTLVILVISILLFFIKEILGYRVVALILLVTVSLLAMVYDIVPVLISAALSALIWNFFFIPPLFSFHIDNAEDVLMFLMYFIIALVNTTLTSKIRKAEQESRDKEEKEKTIMLYDTLLNSLSHELRTPIATILGAVDTIKEGKSKLTDQNKSDLFNEIDKAGTRLNRQVENLLNMSRLESGMLKLHLDWCDVNELVYDTIKKLDNSGSKQTIDFIPGVNLPLFKLDTILIQEVILNLLYNALLYTPDNSIIEIWTSYEDEKCKIVIIDNGTGFPDSEIENAFNKFYRLSGSKPGGTGLGLSIAKGFVEAHNGSIKLDNLLIGGAKFTIEIPAETSFINHLKNE